MTAPELLHQDAATGAEAEAGLDGTLIQIYRGAAHLFDDGRDFLVAKRGGKWVGESREVVDGRIRQITAALIASGVQPGDRVAIMSRNRPEWAMVDLAILHAGAVSVPIYDTLDTEKTGYILADSGAKLAFVEDEEILPRVLDGRKQAKAKDCKRVVVFDPPGSAPDDVVSLGDFELEGEGASEEDRAAVDTRADAVKPSDLASIVYTSGTTGMPKGVMLTHNNFHSNVVAGLRVLPVPERITVLSFLPLSHVFERVAGYYIMLAVGATIAYAESVPAVPQNLVEVKPDVMASVPRLYEKMYAKVNQNVERSSWLKKKIFQGAMKVGGEVAELQVRGEPVPKKLQKKHARADKMVFSKIKEKTGGRLRFFVSGGAPLSKTIEVYFAALGIAIYQGYGLTETSPVVSVNTPTARRFGSVGKVIPGVEVKIAEQDGEILVRGKNVMQGYWNKPEATKEVIDDEGWFHTGDIGHMDDDGFIYVTDRKKELIVMSNGKNVAPQPIENELKNQPHIAQAVVIGDNRNFMTALIAPDFEALALFAQDNKLGTEDPEGLVGLPQVQELIRKEVDTVNASLSRYEQIKKFRLLPRELTQEAGELTPSMKTKRRVIDENHGAIIEEMYAGQADKGA